MRTIEMKKFLSHANVLFLILFVTAACNNEKDLFRPPTTEEEMKEANTFDFSTVNEVNLNVNYNLGGASFAVAFEVYAENPVNEAKDESGNVIGYTMKENVLPIYWDYTDKQGAFSKRGIELPAYAQTLYILSRNPMASPTVMTATVSGNTATASAPAEKAVKSGKQTRAERMKEELPSNLWQKNRADFFAPWIALGPFGEVTGKPAYILDREDPKNAALVFKKTEMYGLYEEVGKAVNVGTECPKEFRLADDITLARNSEVSITMLGGNSCWGSTLGYYYYTGARPASLKNVRVICIFPNTQDGMWERSSPSNTTVGVERGDAVQLMYYPNIQNNGDMSNATKEFPKGTKIGFVLKNNGWGAQGYGYQGYLGVNDFWACSTKGLSDVPFHLDFIGNQLGSESRTAKFQYVSGENRYAILTFEDYNNDANFSDVTFALKPATAFEELPEVVSKDTKTDGVYAFEDLWPGKGDYDMNDVVVKYTYANTIEGNEEDPETMHKIVKESMTFKTFQNYATKSNGLAFKLDNASGYDECKMEVKTTADAEFKPVTFIMETDTDGKPVFTLTDNVQTNMGAEYKMTLTYKNGKAVSDLVSGVAKAKPFIYRLESEGRMEVHIPFEAPTSKASDYYFGKEDDRSDKEKNIYYVRAGNYPFAFYLAGATEEDIQPLLNRDNERTEINVLYPRFLNWATSNGSNDKDWYKIGSPTQ